MPYIYPTANLLEGKPRVGKGECVELVWHYAKVPPSSTWKPGEQVWGNKTLKPGTAIATFINGRYPAGRQVIMPRSISAKPANMSTSSTNGTPVIG